MGNTAKTDNFLKAIKKYAKAQKTALQGEVKHMKTERIKDTEKKARIDSEKMIKDKLEEQRNHQTSVLAKRTQDGQKKLFLERARMTDEIFAKAEKKLIEFTKTSEYTDKLYSSAHAIADLFGENNCVLYVNEKDLPKSDAIKSQFKGTVNILADRTVKIGGIKGYCEKLGIVADETLDSKLSLQREWFIENAGLKVL